MVGHVPNKEIYIFKPDDLGEVRGDDRVGICCRGKEQDGPKKRSSCDSNQPTSE
jgi:hypothetical protein